MPNEEYSIVILILLITLYPLLCAYYYFKSITVEQQSSELQLTELSIIRIAYFYLKNF